MRGRHCRRREFELRDVRFESRGREAKPVGGAVFSVDQAVRILVTRRAGWNKSPGIVDRPRVESSVVSIISFS
jgi:hypothetical protein